MRLIYVDEAGTSAVEPVAVVVGIIAQASTRVVANGLRGGIIHAGKSKTFLPLERPQRKEWCSECVVIEYGHFA